MRDLNRPDDARRLAEQSYILAQEARDRGYEVVALDTLARLALSANDSNALANFEQKVSSYEQRYPEEQQDSVTRVVFAYGGTGIGAERLKKQ